jgi:5-methylcytosine-specific restriction endonuclease McrA
MTTKNEKISNTLKQRFSENEHHAKGKPGWKHSDEMKELKRKRSIEMWDRRGRATDAQKRARNKANVYAYRARMKNAIPADSNLTLIREIYECCPDGYHVDHIVAIASGGQHHQDNLQYLPVSENCRKGKRDVYDKSLAICWRTIVRI